MGYVYKPIQNKTKIIPEMLTSLLGRVAVSRERLKGIIEQLAKEIIIYSVAWKLLAPPCTSTSFLSLPINVNASVKRCWTWHRPIRAMKTRVSSRISLHNCCFQEKVWPTNPPWNPFLHLFGISQTWCLKSLCIGDLFIDSYSFIIIDVGDPWE